MIKRIFNQLISAVRQGNVDIAMAEQKKQRSEKLRKLGFGRGDEVRRRRQEKKQAKK